MHKTAVGVCIILVGIGLAVFRRRITTLNEVGRRRLGLKSQAANEEVTLLFVAAGLVGAGLLVIFGVTE